MINYLRLKTEALFSGCGSLFSGYTEKSARRVAAGIISSPIRGRLFQDAGALFLRTRQSANVFSHYTGVPRTEKKRQGGPGGDYLQLIRRVFFSGCGVVFSGYTGKKRALAGRPIIYPQNRGRFFRRFLFFRL